MQGSKRARNTPSITNSGKIFGIMGGLARRVGLSNAGTYNHQVIKGGRGLPDLYGKSPAFQKNYLSFNKLLLLLDENNDSAKSLCLTTE